ncbi:MAG TPA: hypothetical protein VLE97_01010 [Gaiellaceae bacterium]|nr:hypothetical protein [Gaiellaceae bacterium]
MSDDAEDLALFEAPKTWEEHWKGMPSFRQVDLEPYRTIPIHFKDAEDVRRFAELVGQMITPLTKSLWWPKAEVTHFMDKRFVSTTPRALRYPLYIISKGRWESRQTVRQLEAIKLPYRIVVEPQERDLYAAVVDPAKILVLPFSNLGQGSIPARNWVWEHALASGAKRHWILDDNLKGFYRMTDNLPVPIADGTIFAAAEDFVDRYENVGLAGFNYFMFKLRKSGVNPAFYLNTRIYSCILIDNALEFRWRGRYNEDTDLSLRVLKSGLCTVLFHTFLCDKSTTMTMKGGNTDELYAAEDGRLKMAESLVEQHPDVVKITRKWDRWQHQVDYRPFRVNRLKLREDVEPPRVDDDYGMELVRASKLEATSAYEGDVEDEGETNEERDRATERAEAVARWRDGLDPSPSAALASEAPIATRSHEIDANISETAAETSVPLVSAQVSEAEDRDIGMSVPSAYEGIGERRASMPIPASDSLLGDDGPATREQIERLVELHGGGQLGRNVALRTMREAGVQIFTLESATFAMLRDAIERKAGS